MKKEFLFIGAAKLFGGEMKRTKGSFGGGWNSTDVSESLA